MNSSTILDIFGVKDVKEKEVGIEIEMEGEALFNAPLDNWRIATDGSLRGECLEYVFIEPVKRHKVLETLVRLQEAFLAVGSKLKPSDRCGVHVHLNCQRFTVQQVLTFATLYLSLEGLLMRWCGEDREGNIFTMRLKDAEAAIPELIKAQITGSLRDLQCDTYRYSSLNFSSLSKYGSLEFRGMRTPKKLLNITVWVDMLLAIKDRSLMYSHPKDVVEAFSIMGPEGFLKHIMENYAEGLMCNGFEKMMFESIRLVQDIAYCEPLAEHMKTRPDAWMVPLEYDRNVYKHMVQAGYKTETRDDYWPWFPNLESVPELLLKEGQRAVIGAYLYAYTEQTGWMSIRHKAEVGFRKHNQPAYSTSPHSWPLPAGSVYGGASGGMKTAKLSAAKIAAMKNSYTQWLAPQPTTPVPIEPTVIDDVDWDGD